MNENEAVQSLSELIIIILYTARVVPLPNFKVGLPLWPVNLHYACCTCIGDTQHSDEDGPVKVKQGRFVCTYCGDSFYHAKRLISHSEKEHNLNTGRNNNIIIAATCKVSDCVLTIAKK